MKPKTTHTHSNVVTTCAPRGRWLATAAVGLAGLLSAGACKGDNDTNQEGLKAAANRASPPEQAPEPAEPPPPMVQASSPQQPGGGDPTPPGSPPSEGAEAQDVSKEKLDVFVRALAQVREVRDQFAPKINDAENKETAQALQQEATIEIQKRLNKVGLEPTEYEQIAQKVAADPELQAQVEARIQNM